MTNPGLCGTGRKNQLRVLIRESLDLGESQKGGTTSWLTEAGKAALVEEQEWPQDYGAVFEQDFWAIRQITVFREMNIKELRPIHIWKGSQKTIS